MPKRIHLLLGDKDFYGQARKPWVSMQTELLCSELTRLGYDVRKSRYHNYCNSLYDLNNEIVLYSFSQISNIRSYIKDLMWHLHQRGNILLPSFQLLQCHENKGYQEILKKELGIDQPRGWYLSNLNALDDYALSFPLVLKTIEGSNARGVFLVNSKDEIRKIVAGLTGTNSPWERLDLLRRRYFRRSKKFPGWDGFDPLTDLQQYSDYIKPQMRFVLQEFVPGLDSDYRVIVFWDRYYVSRRLTHKGDWRASGTKLFTFSREVPEPLLDHAATLHRMLPSPLLGMDLGWHQGKPYLFEFQASHMGMSTVTRNTGYFVQNEQGWGYEDRRLSLEEELARAIDLYLQNMYPEHLG